MLARLGIALAQGFQRRNGRIIDKAQMLAIQRDLGRVPGRVELVEERGGRGKEQRAMQLITLAALRVLMGVGIQLPRMLPGKVERRDDDTEQHRHGQVGQHRDHSHRNDRQHIIHRHLVQHPQRRPGKGLLGHHEHHSDQRRQWNTLDQRRQEQHEQQNHHPGHHPRQPPPAIGAEVDHRLPDHRAAAHAAAQARHHVRSAQCHTLAVREATALGDFVGQVEGEQGFQQADHGHQHRVGGDDLQGFQIPRHIRQRQPRQATGDVRHVAQGAGRQPEHVHHQANTEDRHQGRRHRAGQFRQHINHRHGQRHQADHQVQRRATEPVFAVLEMLQLSHGDDDGQAVHEAKHDRVWHQAHQFAQTQQAEQDHHHTAQQHRGQQVLHAVLHHQGDDHHRHRAGSAGDHPRPPAEQRRQGTNDERAIQAHQRVEVGHQGKGDALGDQGERGGEAGEQVGA